MAARRRGHPSAPAAYLIVGADSYLRTQHREEIIAANVPAEGRAFAVAKLSLDRTPLAELLAQASMRPMLSPRQVLVVGGLEALDDQHVGLLEQYLEDPADFSVLVFEAEKLDRRTRVARLLLEHCEVLDAESPDESEAVRAAQGFARELGVQLDPSVAEEMVFILGHDQGRMRTELEKLRAYAGEDRTVTSADLVAVVNAAREFSVFELADLLAERRRDEVLRLLHHLLAAGERPIGMVGLLAWLYRQLLHAQGLPRSTPAWKAAQILRAPRSRVEALLRQARRFSPEELRSGFAALLEADVRLKSSAPNPAAVLETLVVRLTAVPAAGGVAQAAVR